MHHREQWNKTVMDELSPKYTTAGTMKGATKNYAQPAAPCGKCVSHRGTTKYKNGGRNRSLVVVDIRADTVWIGVRAHSFLVHRKTVIVTDVCECGLLGTCTA